MDNHNPEQRLSVLRLGIISDCIHFYTPGGRIGTDTHIFYRQISALAKHFGQVIICCPFIKYPGNISYSEYKNDKITFIASPHVGGNRVKDKLHLIRAIPTWLKLFREVDQKTDIVYQRFPNNLNIPGFFYFYFKRKKVFATFTGSWDKDPGASFTTRVQRFLLNNYFRGPVWVYTNEKLQKPHIISSFSPSYSRSEWTEEHDRIQQKINSLDPPGHGMLKMISVGTLCERKNHAYILQTCVKLKMEGIPFHLVIAGAGKRMEEYLSFVAENELSENITFTGSVHYNRLRQLYREADYVVQSPVSEPYGKVPIEGYFHGLIPILSSASVLAGMITNNGKRGFLFDIKEEDALLNILRYIYCKMPENLKSGMIKDGRIYVKQLTIEDWAEDYVKILNRYYFNSEDNIIQIP